MLDTEPTSMHAAFALYRKLGFTPFEPARPGNPVDVVYLHRLIDTSIDRSPSGSLSPATPS